MLGFKTLSHLLEHCFLVRPGTSAATSFQFMSPCVCTASFSLMSSSAVQLPLRPLARPMLRSKTTFHLAQQSAPTLFSRSTRDQRGYGNPISLVLLPALLLGSISSCTSQLCIFFLCPATGRHSSHSIWLRIQHVIYICIYDQYRHQLQEEEDLPKCQMKQSF
jgi:hypothetical protein